MIGVATRTRRHPSEAPSCTFDPPCSWPPVSPWSRAGSRGRAGCTAAISPSRRARRMPRSSRRRGRRNRHLGGRAQREHHLRPARWPGDIDALWPAGGRALLTDSVAIANADGTQITPRIVPDGAGGAIVAAGHPRQRGRSRSLRSARWHPAPSIPPGPPTGRRCARSWAAGEPRVSPTARAARSSPGWTRGPAQAWRHLRPARAGIGRRGSALARQRPRRVAPDSRSFPPSTRTQAAPSSPGTTRAAPRPASTSTQHVLSSGVDPAWPVNGRALCTAGGGQGHPTIAADAAHGAIVAWTDSRIVGTAHIFAQHVPGSSMPHGPRMAARLGGRRSRPDPGCLRRRGRRDRELAGLHGAPEHVCPNLTAWELRTRAGRRAGRR